METNIKKARKMAGLSQKEVAVTLKVSAPTVSDWESGNMYPSAENLKKLSVLLNCPIDYLLNQDNFFDGPPRSTGGVWIPVLGKIAAGIPIEAIEDIEDYEEITKEMASHGEHFALRVKGDSMEPKISNGDVVIVCKQEDCETGDVAAVIVNGESATVKRIKKRPEGLMLIPSNPAYEPMFYSNEDVEKLPVKILGKVVELRAKF